MGGVVAAIHILACNNAVFLMAIFYFTSSYLTKYKAEIKKKIEEDFQEGNFRKCPKKYRVLMEIFEKAAKEIGFKSLPTQVSYC